MPSEHDHWKKEDYREAITSPYWLSELSDKSNFCRKSLYQKNVLQICQCTAATKASSSC